MPLKSLKSKYFLFSLFLFYVSLFIYLFIYFNRFVEGGGGAFNNQARSSGVNLMTFVIEIEKGRHTLPKTPENL